MQWFKVLDNAVSTSECTWLSQPIFGGKAKVVLFPAHSMFLKTDVCVLAVDGLLLKCCYFAGYVANVPIIEPWGNVFTYLWTALSQNPGAPEVQPHLCS